MTMNGAEVHLLMNHFPVVGFPIALLAAAHGHFRKEVSVTIYSYYLTIFIWLTTVISFYSGDPAEHVLKSGTDFADLKSFIHVHERSAKFALIIASVAALSAVLSLPEVTKQEARLRGPRVRKVLNVIYGLSLVAATIWLAIVAHQGGLIRHLEIR